MHHVAVGKCHPQPQRSPPMQASSHLVVSAQASVERAYAHACMHVFVQPARIPMSSGSPPAARPRAPGCWRSRRRPGSGRHRMCSPAIVRACVRASSAVGPPSPSHHLVRTAGTYTYPQGVRMRTSWHHGEGNPVTAQTCMPDRIPAAKLDHMHRCPCVHACMHARARARTSR